jgi:5'-nucleotidase
MIATRARIGDWMQTYSGKQFWPLDPRPEEIYLEDIAHALSNQCRFAGHVKEFYSVAQHSVIVAYSVPPEHQAWGLLHDATEAYLVDLPRPLKRYSKIGDEYQLVENRLMCAIADRFGLPRAISKEIHDADDIVLMTEKRDIMGHHAHLPKWHETAAPLEKKIKPWCPSVAEEIFLGYAKGLGLK